MRIIKFKPANASNFLNYVDIGSCEKDFYFINFFLPGSQEKRSGKLYFESYDLWYDNFKSESPGSQMIIINYYLTEFLGWNIGENKPQIKYFKDLYGEKTFNVISENLYYLLQFNSKWFEEKAPIFKGLDFDWDDVEETFLNTIENEDGIIEEIEFRDGSILKFLDDDDTIRSFYIIESDYFVLKEEIEKIVLIFKP